MDIFDRPLLVRRQARAAAGASEHDFLLRRAAEDIAVRLDAINRAFPVAAVVGAHHGALSERLLEKPFIETVISMERCAQLLAQAPGLRVAGDEEALPFAAESLNLAVSALSLQFANDLPGALIQIRRALKPDGLFIGALMGGETLTELRAAFAQAELEVEGGVSPRVAPFADVRDCGALLQRAGFALPVADSDRFTVTYANAFALMRDLRGMGATNALIARRRTPLRRTTLFRMAEIYAERFGDARGRVAATFEIVTLTGWAPHESQQKPLSPGSAKTRLADALGAPERKPS
ncbi:MAG: methyltransferase domain-containing protein [Hyphomicrobiales bacterium]|nr:methyltransferase domain-containing protein [Hyphomicrobiales bacterium]